VRAVILVTTIRAFFRSPIACLSSRMGTLSMIRSWGDKESRSHEEDHHRRSLFGRLDRRLGLHRPDSYPLFPRPQVAQPPDLSQAPARVYGKIEPAGREVFVASPVTRRITRIRVQEGDAVKQGQVLLSLESEIERARLQVALAKVESLRRTVVIDQDILKRRESLYVKEADTEYAFTQARLQVELDLSNLVLAEKEVDLARAELDRLELRSPSTALSISSTSAWGSPCPRMTPRKSSSGRPTSGCGSPSRPSGRTGSGSATGTRFLTRRPMPLSAGGRSSPNRHISAAGISGPKTTRNDSIPSTWTSSSSWTSQPRALPGTFCCGGARAGRGAGEKVIPQEIP